MEAHISPSTHVDHAYMVAEYLDDDIKTDISSLDKKAYFELQSVKIELADNEELLDCIEIDEKFEIINPEAIEDLGHNDENLANIHSPNDTNKATNTRNVKNKTSRKKVSKIIKHVKSSKNVRNDKLLCVLCNEIFSHRTSLNRHTNEAHNMFQCIRCRFTTTTRFVGRKTACFS